MTESRPPEPASTWAPPQGPSAPSPALYDATLAPYGAPPSYGSPSPYGSAPADGTRPPYPPYSGQPGGTDGTAIAALVLAIIPGTGLIGFILGMVALPRIRQSGRGGRGLAIAAIVISVVWALVLGSLIVLGVTLTASGDVSGNPTKPGSVFPSELKAGDCLSTLPMEAGTVGSIPVTRCTKLHRAEVYAVFHLPKGDYPGEQSLTKRAENGCGNRLPRVDVSKQRGLAVGYLYPTQVNWRLGYRSVTCLVVSSTPVKTRIVPKR